MLGKFLLNSDVDSTEGNIYADKSSLILNWLFTHGNEEENFSIRKVAKEIKVSVGLVQRIFEILVSKGILQTKGLRTAKKFSFNRSSQLLNEWTDSYNIVKKCRMRTYSSGYQNKSEIFEILKNSIYKNNIALALHSAAEFYGYKNTNLDTLELYLLDSKKLKNIEEILQLESQEKGYKVLLIEPYYRSLLEHNESQVSPPLLTYLDLYHFPLRGREQAEFIASRDPLLKLIHKNYENNRR